MLSLYVSIITLSLTQLLILWNIRSINQTLENIFLMLKIIDKINGLEASIAKQIDAIKGNNEND